MNGNNTSSSVDFGMGEMKFVSSRDLYYVILCILIVFMNAFVILLFSFNSILRKPINFLLVSLSVSDLLCGMIAIPLALVCTTKPICLPCVFSYSFVVFTSISTVLHILVISYERYIRIVFPFRMQHVGRASFELKLVAGLWFISILVPPVQFLWWPPTESSCEAELTEEMMRHEQNFTISVHVIFVALPVLLLIYADVSVFFVVRRQLDGIDKTSIGPRDSQQRRRLLQEARVLALFAVMMLYFVISWSFYFASITAHSFFQKELLVPEWLVLSAERLRCSTPLVNPILYILLKHDFRRVVYHGIRRLLRNSGLFHDQTGSSVQSSNGIRTARGQSDSRNVTEKTVFL